MIYDVCALGEILIDAIAEAVHLFPKPVMTISVAG